MNNPKINFIIQKTEAGIKLQLDNFKNSLHKAIENNNHAEIAQAILDLQGLNYVITEITQNLIFHCLIPEKEKQEFEMLPVKSGNVSHIGYDYEKKTVHLQFFGGGEYKYSNVPQAEFEKLKTAPSIGSHLRLYFYKIYTYERVE